MKTPLCLKNVDSLSKGALSVGAKDFYVVGSYPQNGQVAVPLDVTLKLQFNDIVSKAQGLDSFFFLLNQFTGVTSSIPASCIRSVDDYILQFNVIDCFGDRLGEIMLRQVVRLCYELGLYTTAEGVEAEDQVDFLRALDCTDIQGYFFSPPLPVEKYTEKLRQQARKRA